MFLAEIRKLMYTLFKPQFYCIKMSFQGRSKLYRHVFIMQCYIQKPCHNELRYIEGFVYHIRPNYCSYPYKGTAKQICCLQITACVLFVYFFIMAYVVGTLWIASICWCNLNEYPQHMLLLRKSDKRKIANKSSDKSFTDLFLKCTLSRNIFDHKFSQ